MQEELTSFSLLGPEIVLTLVEKELGVQCNNLFRPLSSYINRVFEVETFEGTRFVIKFYRPGRWSKEAILEEHQFVLDLAGQEIPVISPCVLKSGSTLGSYESFYFSIYPYCGGRSVDEFDENQWIQLGRLLGRVHQVGEQSRTVQRVVMAPEKSTSQQLVSLMGCSCIPDDIKPMMEPVVSEIIKEITPMFHESSFIRIHGDCHFANLIDRVGESLFIIDFDDMVMGPPIQDLWMLLPGVLDDSAMELDWFLEGYETFRRFNFASLQLVEPLRAMRFIHYMAWCTHQVENDGMTRAIDGFGTRQYWQQEIGDLEDQLLRIQKSSHRNGNKL